jgi:TRAP-type mannitol/chloroaromatic compound transport system permease small subunit
MLKAIDNISEFAGKLAAWLFFAVGFFITYEVFMRHVFTMPTIWVDEVSRIIQIWAAYLAAAFALKHREMVVIDIAFRDENSTIRKCLDSFALVLVIIFCAVAVYYGFELWLKSTLRGHTTDTYLALPKWFTQASIWVGFGLLLLQAFAEIFKIWTPVSPAAVPK